MKYNKNDVVVDILALPLQKHHIKRNIKNLLKIIKSIKYSDKELDNKTITILDGVLPHVRIQSSRLLRNINSRIDLIAWISRNLLELWFTTRYMYQSSNNYDEVLKEQLKDLKDIEKVIYPQGIPSETDHKLIKEFHSDMTKLWKGMKDYGVAREKLNRPNTMRFYAEKADLLNEYNTGYRIQSKYVHPTSYLIFGKQSFVFSNDTYNFFWTLAQYYLAFIVRDLLGMIETDKNSKGDKSSQKKDYTNY